MIGLDIEMGCLPESTCPSCLNEMARLRRIEAAAGALARSDWLSDDDPCGCCIEEGLLRALVQAVRGGDAE